MAIEEAILSPGDSFLLTQHMLDIYAGSRADPFLLPPEICFK